MTPKQKIYAAIGPPRSHSAALTKVAPFLDDPSTQDAACKIAYEIMDDGTGSIDRTIKAVLAPLHKLAKRGVDEALPALSKLVWALDGNKRYAELLGCIDVLIAACKATPTEGCLCRSSREALYKQAKRRGEELLYLRMRLEANLVTGDDKRAVADEKALEKRGGELRTQIRLSLGIWDEGTGTDLRPYALMNAARALRKAGQLAEARVLLDRARPLVEPSLLADLAKEPIYTSKSSRGAWRAELWAEDALHIEARGDMKAAKALLKRARDANQGMGGHSFIAGGDYVADTERMKLPEFR